VISPKQITLPDKTQHSQETDIHAPGGFRKSNRSKRANADLRPRLRGYWEFSADYYLKVNNAIILKKMIAAKFGRNKNPFLFVQRGQLYCLIYVTD
jgi:hypothetical protein